MHCAGALGDGLVGQASAKALHATWDGKVQVRGLGRGGETGRSVSCYLCVFRCWSLSLL